MPRGCRQLIMALVAAATLGCDRGAADAKPRIVLPGTARTLEFPGALTTVLLESSATQGDVAVLEIVLAPRSFGAPPHVHHDEDEYLYVLEGEVQLLNEDQVVAAPRGAFAAMPRGYLHAFWNASDAPARALVLIAPGDFGAFFDRVVAELRASGTVEATRIGEALARIAKDWNVDLHPELVPDEAKPFLPR